MPDQTEATDETESTLEEAFETATAEAEAAFERLESDAVEDDERDLRESVERLADGVADATLEGLLDTAGFAAADEDVSPVDVPSLLRDGDADAVLRLRRLLHLADLGESWPDLTADDRFERLEAAVAEDDGEEDEDDSRSVADLLSSVWSDGEEGDEESSDEAEESDPSDDDEGLLDVGDDDEAGETGDDDESDDDLFELGDSDDADESADGLSRLEAHLDQLKERVEATSAGETQSASDAETSDDSEEAGDEEEDDDGLLDVGDDDEDEDDEDDDRGVDAHEDRFSTVPSSRLDTGRGTRFSSIRGRK
jgi:hypothetical protein